jgi:AcrR family transcriptional regulator
MSRTRVIQTTITSTRELLLEVARQLFAKVGFTNTTMNDIAKSAQKGRRTLYVYFKNKEDVYSAVVEQEMNKLLEALEVVANSTEPPQNKLIDYIYTRLDKTKEIVKSNGTLRADFFSDFKAVEMVRKKMDIREHELLKKILREGVDKGIFYVRSVDFAAFLVLNAIRGLEVPYMKQSVADRINDSKDDIVRVLFHGLLK